MHLRWHHTRSRPWLDLFIIPSAHARLTFSPLLYPKSSRHGISPLRALEYGSSWSGMQTRVMGSMPRLCASRSLCRRIHTSMSPAVGDPGRSTLGCMLFARSFSPISDSGNHQSLRDPAWKANTYYTPKWHRPCGPERALTKRSGLSELRAAKGTDDLLFARRGDETSR